MNAVSFRYTARTAAGEVIRGSMEAPTREAVLASLATRAVFVTLLEREHVLARTLRRSLAVGVPRRSALLTFFRAFATLVRAGVPLRRALDVCIERTGDGALREALRAVAADVERGSAIGDALSTRPRAFGKLQIAMVRAGEAGGILDDVLERLAALMERDADVRKRLRAALAYPAAVLAAASILIVFLLARIVPMFAQMFAAFHAPLTLSTRLLLGLGNALAQPALWIGAGASVTLAIAAAVVAARTEDGAMAFDRARLSLPVFGPLLRRSITARIARTLATLLRSGMDLVAAIAAVGPVAGSRVYARALARVDVALREGDALSAPLRASTLFDPLVVALVGVGEETGLLDEMLLRVAASFESDVESALATLSATLEPALIGALGVVVGFIVFSVFIPLYSLIGSVSS